LIEPPTVTEAPSSVMDTPEMFWSALALTDIGTAAVVSVESTAGVMPVKMTFAGMPETVNVAVLVSSLLPALSTDQNRSVCTSEPAIGAVMETAVPEVSAPASSL